MTCIVSSGALNSTYSLTPEAVIIIIIIIIKNEFD